MNLDTLPTMKPRLVYSWGLRRWIGSPKLTDLSMGDKICLIESVLQLNRRVYDQMQ